MKRTRSRIAISLVVCWCLFAALQGPSTAQESGEAPSPAETPMDAPSDASTPIGEPLAEPTPDDSATASPTPAPSSDSPTPTPSAAPAPDQELIPDPLPPPDDSAVGDVVELRTKTSRTFVTDEGHYRAEMFPGAIHYRSDQDDAWHVIDNSLVATSASGYSHENRANSYRLHLPNSLNAPVRVSKGERWLKLTLQGASGAMDVDGSRADYEDAFEGVDVSYTAGNESVKEEIALQSAGAPRVFEFDLMLSPGLMAREAQGAIEVIDSEGDSVFTLPAPFMYDSPADPAPAEFSDDVSMALEEQPSGYEITLDARSDWLDDPHRAWPVVIDPTVSVAVSKDCHIKSDANANSAYCTRQQVEVGRDGNVARGLVEFKVDDNLTLATNQVLHARMGLYLFSELGSGSTPVDVHRVKNYWSSGNVTWNNRETGVPWEQPGGDFTSPAHQNSSVSGQGRHYWHVSKPVHQWVAGPNAGGENEYGFLIKAADETANKRFFFSSEQDPDSTRWPVLEVTYAPWTGVRRLHTLHSFELTDRMQMGVNVANGNLVAQEKVLGITGTGLDLSLTNVYNHLGTSTSTTGDWRLNVPSLSFHEDSVVLTGPSGYQVPFFEKQGGGFDSPSGIDADLTLVGDSYKLTFKKTDEVWTFVASSGLLTQQADRNGNVISYSYLDGRLELITDTQGRTVDLIYTAGGKLDRIEDPAVPVRTYRYGYNAAGRLETFTDADNGVTTFYYDTSNRLKEIVAPEGNITRITYNLSNKVETVKQIENRGTQAAYTTSFDYGAPDSTQTLVRSPNTTSSQTSATRYTYDRLGRVTKVVDALGKSRDSGYTANSDVMNFLEPSTSTGPDAALTWDETDGKNNLKGIKFKTDGTSGTMEAAWKYDHPGRPFLPSEHTDWQGKVWTYDYDATGNLKIVDNAAAGITYRYVYNDGSETPSQGKGTLRKITDARQVDTLFSYDSNGNLAGIDYPAPLGNWVFDTDELSRMETVTDGKGQVVHYTYDALDRVELVDYPSSPDVDYDYDRNGNLISRADFTGTTLFAYDELNRVKKMTLPSGAETTFTYDGRNNLRTLTEAGRTITYDYNDVNSLQSVAYDNKTITFGYDSNHNRNVTTYSGQAAPKLNVEWDRANRIKRVTGAGICCGGVYDLTYDYKNSAGKETMLVHKLTEGNGNVTTYEYDAAGRLKSAETKNSSAQVIDRYAYTYDANSNLETVTPLTGPVTTFTYNDANQLKTEQRGTTSKTYFYDGNGSEILKEDTATGDDERSAGYNDKDQTTSVSAGGTVTNMEYADAMQDLRTKAGSKEFFYNVLGLSREKTGTQTTTYVRDDNGRLLSQITPTGKNYWYFFDRLDSVVGLVDSDSKAMVASYKYDPYGRLTSSEPSIYNPWRFASGYFDSATGLTKFGTRYYDPAISRWTQRDPEMGRISDPMTLNPYLYVGGEPINRVDPTGRIYLGRGQYTTESVCGNGFVAGVADLLGFFGEGDRAGETAIKAAVRAVPFLNKVMFREFAAGTSAYRTGMLYATGGATAWNLMCKTVG